MRDILHLMTVWVSCYEEAMEHSRARILETESCYKMSDKERKVNAVDSVPATVICGRSSHFQKKTERRI